MGKDLGLRSLLWKELGRISRGGSGERKAVPRSVEVWSESAAWIIHFFDAQHPLIRNIDQGYHSSFRARQIPTLVYLALAYESSASIEMTQDQKSFENGPRFDLKI